MYLATFTNYGFVIIGSRKVLKTTNNSGEDNQQDEIKNNLPVDIKVAAEEPKTLFLLSKCHKLKISNKYQQFSKIARK